MKLFLDSADIEEIKNGAMLGVISGVTTNPSLAAKAGVGGVEAYKLAVQEIAGIVDGPISIEVISDDPDEMILEGRDYATWIDNPWVKLPSSAAGFQAMKVLSMEGIQINQTLCFSVNQALLGAQAGATAVSPFVGRLDDIGEDGMALVRDIADVFKIHEIKTKVLAASIRGPKHCVDAARAGAHIATIPINVLKQMVKHPLTDIGIQKFNEDWEKARKG